MNLMYRRRTGNRRRRTPRKVQPKSQPNSQCGSEETRQQLSLHLKKNLNRTLLSNLSSFVAAVRFLTIIPLPGRFGSGSEELARAVPFFPLVGLLLGCVAVPIAWGLHTLAPPLATAVLLVFLLLSFSGGLHLDGLADTADGFFSARPREQMLKIMRDSATGAMGVIALVLVLVLKVACLSTMPGNTLVVSVFLIPIAGRIAILLLMGLLPYIRPEDGIGSVFSTYYDNRHAMTMALAGLIAFGGTAWAAAGSRGVLAAFVVLLLPALFAVFCRRKIGGVTGDTLGAVCELTEAVVALVFVLRIGGGA